MNANELMICNIVDLNGSIVEVTPRMILEQYQTNIENESTYLKPIRITEEWLLKFGFEKIGYTRFVKKDFPLHLWFSPASSSMAFDDNSLCSIEYIHQLQNLYFALTQ